jgi:hypothetical protein
MLNLVVRRETARFLKVNMAVNSVLNVTVRGVPKARNLHIGLLLATVYSDYVVPIELDRYIVYTFLAA